MGTWAVRAAAIPCLLHPLGPPKHSGLPQLAAAPRARPQVSDAVLVELLVDISTNRLLVGLVAIVRSAIPHSELSVEIFHLVGSVPQD